MRRVPLVAVSLLLLIIPGLFARPVVEQTGAPAPIETVIANSVSEALAWDFSIKMESDCEGWDGEIKSNDAARFTKSGDPLKGKWTANKSSASGSVTANWIGTDEPPKTKRWSAKKPGDCATPTPMATDTPRPPTNTPYPTPLPTATRFPTQAPNPSPYPTATATNVPPTATNPPAPTATNTPRPGQPTPTATEVPPTATPTTSPPDEPTATPVPPTATNPPAPPSTPIPPTATPRDREELEIELSGSCIIENPPVGDFWVTNLKNKATRQLHWEVTNQNGQVIREEDFHLLPNQAINIQVPARPQDEWLVLRVKVGSTVIGEFGVPLAQCRQAPKPPGPKTPPSVPTQPPAVPDQPPAQPPVVEQPPAAPSVTVIGRCPSNGIAVFTMSNSGGMTIVPLLVSWKADGEVVVRDRNVWLYPSQSVTITVEARHVAELVLGTVGFEVSTSQCVNVPRNMPRTGDGGMANHMTNSSVFAAQAVTW